MPTEVIKIENRGEENSYSQLESNFYPTWPDERRAECPYCSATLKKIPGAKTKCPQCGQSMYVRKDPLTKSQRVVREDELEPIEDEWAKINGTWSMRLTEKKNREETRVNLAIKLGREPSAQDVQWSLWNQELVKFEASRDWGLYRNTVLSMAQSAKKERNLRDALFLFMDVMYLDACGPCNSGMGWRAADKMYLDYVANMLEKVGKELGENTETVFKAYKERAEILQKGLKLPVDYQVAWLKFCLETKLNF